MRRFFVATAALAFSLTSACVYLAEASDRFEQTSLSLDETAPEQRMNVKVCWSGAEPDNLEIIAEATSADGAGRVSVAIDDWVETIGEDAPERPDRPRGSWYELSGDTLSEACELGVEVVFTLDDPAAGPAEVAWVVEAYASSDSDRTVEELSFTVEVEPL